MGLDSIRHLLALAEIEWTLQANLSVDASGNLARLFLGFNHVGHQVKRRDVFMDENPAFASYLAISY